MAIKKKTTKTTTEKTTKVAKPMSTSKLVEQLRGKLQNVQGSKGDGKRKFNWIRMSSKEGGGKKKHLIRIVEPTAGPAMIVYKRHTNNQQGQYFRSHVDLRYIVSDEEILEAMLERKAFEKSDVPLIKKYGDPFDVLWRALKEQGREKMFRNARIGQKRTLLVAFKDGEFGILDRGITFAEEVIDLIDEYPDLLDWEEGTWLTINVTGTGKGTKYSSLIPGDSGPIEMEVEGDEDPTTPNLYDILAYQTIGYTEKVQFLFNSYPKLVKIASLDADDFGLEDDDLDYSNTNKSENKKRSKSKVKDYEDDEDEAIEDEEEDDEFEDEFEDDENEEDDED